MQFLRTLIWVVLAVLLAIVASNNWAPVSLNLWAGQVLETKIPVLMGVMFLVGFLPPYLILRSRLWQARRRLQNAERLLAEATGPVVPAPEQSVAHEPAVAAP